ncbi:MAG: methyltransferase domain-containing protein, partial [Deltaproteobacteria bacterium]|nr:methyltransferase domain-containing protein [Deltaproteobacteria bacterium]
MSSLSSTVYNEMSDFFSQMIHSEHFNVGLWSLKKKQSISEAQNHLVSSFLSFSQLDPSLNLLDVGCGSGELLAFCSQNYSIRFGLGLDHSGKLIERAKKKNASSSSLSFLEDDIFCLKNYSHYFDRIFALEVAYHFLDKKQLFEFLKQKLAD